MSLEPEVFSQPCFRIQGCGLSVRQEGGGNGVRTFLCLILDIFVDVAMIYL